VADGGHRFELGTDGPSVIVVGVDGSPTSLRAAAYAAGLARRQGAHLVVVFVRVHPAVVGMSASTASLYSAAQDQLEGELQDQVIGAAKTRGVSVELVIGRGDAFTELTRIATEVRADAVVVGASTRAGHRLAGSMAVKLVRAKRWPVTVLP
jgi:nucleotide-binding universal stress UspA family protein